MEGITILWQLGGKKNKEKIKEILKVNDQLRI